MKTLFEIYLSKKKITDLSKKELEKKLWDLQEEHKELVKRIETFEKNEEKSKQSKINKETNEPSSKKAEWEKNGDPKDPSKKGGKNGGRRQGSGNKKKDIISDEENRNILINCPACNTNLEVQEVLETKSRIVEDIPSPSSQTTVSTEIQEKKWCPECKTTVNSVSEKALPGSYLGLNTVIYCAYFWVVTSISFPNIQRYLSSFLQLSLSTSGISKMMIRLSNILVPVYEELLSEVKDGSRVWADETGWRIRGQLHWLWAFANETTAYYWIDKSRGGGVVERILGDIFYGVLISDAWGAYNALQSEKQTCMSHIFRKIRKFIEVYPRYHSIFKFYLKLRRIIKNAKKLQELRGELGEMVFHRRLKKLRTRLSNLLAWPQPNPQLKEIIKKVKRQEKYILTFVEHKGVSSHNNYAEYIIKKGILKRKISGGSMSLEGAKAFAILQSIAQTCHLREISFHGFLKDSLLQYIRTGKPLLISDYQINLKIQKSNKAA